MNYRMLDIFSVRTPSLPLEFYFEINNLDGKDLENYLKNNKMLDFNEKLLFFSSLEMYKNSKISIHKNDSYYDTLKKYLIRSATRPTPFGLCSGVSLGTFDKKTNLILNNQNSTENIYIDNLWLINIIKLLEKNPSIIKKLKFRFNKNVYQVGDRLKCLNMVDTINNNDINSYSIKNNDLVKLIRELTLELTEYSFIFSKIKESYNNVDDELIEKVIFELIENEFLISSLYPDIYDMNLLNHIIIQLENIEEKQICNALKGISFDMNSFSQLGKLNILEKNIKIMENLSPQKNYYYINKYNNFSSCTLENKVKTDLENFINSFKKIYVDIEDEFDINILKQFFIENYGHNILVKLTNFIEKDVLKKSFLQNKKDSEREKTIKNIIDTKIFKSLINNENEVYLYEKDFEDVIKKQENCEFSDSIDLNLCITKENNNYEYYIAPNIGADKAGCMINRFAKECDSYLYDRYLNYIIKNDNDFENINECLLVDIKDILSYPRGMNISSFKKINNHCINFKFSADKNEEISLNDLYLRLNYDDSFDIIDIKHNKKIYIITNDMLNMNTNNNIVAFLRNITQIQLKNPLYRLQNLTNNSYIFTPQIRYENVIIQPKKWIFSTNLIRISDFKDFKEDFNKVVLLYKVDQFVYLTIGDNRLLLDISLENSLKTIYKYLKRHRKIEFTENEFNNLNSLLIKNNFNKKFVSEISFSFIIEDKYKNKKEYSYLGNDDLNKNILINNKRINIPFENNWLYYKIYIPEENKDNLLYYLEKISNKLIDVDKLFFIRYFDDLGYHFRFRIKFDNLDNIEKNICIINNNLKKMLNDGVCNNIIIDTYNREINRYGGLDLIDFTESFFTVDSKFVFKLNNIFNLDNEDELEKAYFIGIVSLLRIFYKNDLEMLKSLNSNIEYKNYRKEYKYNKNKYLNLYKSLFTENTYNDDLNELISLRNSYLNIIKNKLDNSDLTNNKDNIIYSLNHMFCNRLTGINELENKMLSIIRHSLRDIINEKNYTKNK